jgi:hypothetical protein
MLLAAVSADEEARLREIQCLLEASESGAEFLRTVRLAAENFTTVYV